MLKFSSVASFFHQVSQKHRQTFFVFWVALALSVLVSSPSPIFYANSPTLKSTQQPSLDSSISALATNSCSGINFPGPDFSTGNAPTSLAIGDIDGDGIPDLTATNQNDNTVSILRNTSSIGNVSFAPQLTFFVGNSPQALALGDIDGDGKLDLAVANGVDNTISIVRNTSSIGNISFVSQVIFSVGNTPRSIAIKDIDGDGKPDITVTNSSDNTVSILRNISSIGKVLFISQVTFPTGSSPRSIAVGDIDGDNKPDLAVTNLFDNTISVLKNTSTIGNVSFASQVTFSTGTGPISVAIGDLDGDNKPDLAIANQLSNTASVLRNTSSTGNVSFAPQVVFSTDTVPASVAIGDIDGDGKPDLAVANRGFNTASILRNTSTSGSVSFAAQVSSFTSLDSISLVIRDLDGDGKVDLVTANFGNNTISVLRNISSVGNISFPTRVNFTTGTHPFSVVIGDIDGDNKPDLAVTNIGLDGMSNTVSVLRNTSTSALITFAPQVTFFVGTGPLSVAIGDLDGDNKPDLAVTNLFDSTVSILRNTSSIGNVSFASQVTFSTGTNPIFSTGAPLSVAIGDLDGDNKPDLAIANINNNTVSVLRNISSIGNISFAPLLAVATGSSPRSVTIGDIDGDNKPDLAVANINNNSISVLRNISSIGNISFASQVIFSTSIDPISVVAKDIDGDSKPELIVANSSNSTISILRNTSTNGNISFVTKVDFSTGLEPLSVATEDLDGDGKLDLAITNFASNTVSVLRNTSNTSLVSFASQQLFSTGSLPSSVAIGDIDGDGKPDLAIANQLNNTVSVLPNTCVTKGLAHSTIYVADTLNNRIQRSINNGMSWQIVGNGAGVGLSQFNAPKSVTTDSTDSIIFVADTANNRIQRSINGVWSVIATGGTAINQVNQPSGVTYDEINNKLYIADTANSRILVVNNPTTSPNFAVFAGATAGTAIGKVNQPQSLAIDSTGKVYVADTANNRIQVNSNGLSTGWTVLATAGSAIGQVLAPKGTYVDNNGKIYIADTANNRIQVNSNGIWSVFMSAGTAVGTVNRPEAVIVNTSGNVFIADTGNNRIQSKPNNGGTAIVVGNPGTSVGQFNQPSCIR